MGQRSVLVTDGQGFDPQARDALASAARVTVRPGPELTTADFAAHDAIWVRLSVRIDADLIGAAPRCSIIAVPATGTDHIDEDHCARKAVTILSLKGETSFLDTIPATAEHTLGLIVAAIRQTTACHASVLRGEWDREAYRGRQLSGKTAVVVGHGRVGRRVCAYLRALEMTVVAVDPALRGTTDGCRFEPDLHRALGEADIVTVHVDLSPRTQGLLGEQEFACMARAPVLVNTARGAVVDSGALVAALRSGVVSAAALDVIDGEPHPPPDHPLVEYARTNDNLTLTPHVGGNTHESVQATERFLAAKLAEHLRASPGPRR